MNNNAKFIFSMIWRILFSMIPLLFGYTALGVVLCASVAATYTAANGLLVGAASSLLALFASIFFVGGTNGFFIGIAIVLTALAAGLTIRYKTGFFKSFAGTSAAYFAPYMAMLKFQADSAGLSVTDAVTSPMYSLADRYIAAIGEGINQSGVSIEEMRRLLYAMTDAFASLLPSALIISSLIAGYAIVWFTAMRFRGGEYDNHHSFSMIKASRIWTLAFVAAFAVAVLSDQAAASIAINVAAVTLFMFSASGVSLIDFYFRKSGINTVWRVFIYGAALFFGSFTGIIFVLPIVGLVDALFDFRARSLKKETESNEQEKDSDAHSEETDKTTEE